MPEKKNNHYYRSVDHIPQVQTNYQEQRYISRYISENQVSTLSSADNKRSGGVFWSRSLSQRSQLEEDFDSSSDDEHPSGSNRSSSIRSKSSFLKKYNSSELRKERSESEAPTAAGEETLYELLPDSTSMTESYSRLHNKSFERFIPSSESSSAAHMNDNNLLRSSDSSLDGTNGLGPRTSSTSSSFNLRSSSPLLNPNQTIEQKPAFGTIEISLLYDDSHQALHCSVHRAKVI